MTFGLSAVQWHPEEIFFGIQNIFGIWLHSMGLGAFQS